jgi:hypothetical protein
MNLIEHIADLALIIEDTRKAGGDEVAAVMGYQEYNGLSSRQTIFIWTEAEASLEVAE